MDPTSIRKSRAPDLIPGYRLEKVVGRGGMGEVHRAVQLSLGRVVAIKLLAGELAQDRSFVARFEKEAAALASLSHPNIVSIVDKGKANETYYLVMEFVDGPSLREVMRSPLLDTAQSFRTVVELCRAVDYAHSRGVVHRDLKPENILFDEQAGGLAKVTDFGLASFLDDKGAKASRFNMTETHVAMGTQSYMAPEQRVDAKNADYRADIYSLGVILYEVLVGDLPVGNFDAPSQRKPGLDARIDAIVARCLKPLPQDRYQKVSELLADLDPLVPAGPSQPPRRVSQLERLQANVQRVVRRATRVLGATVVSLAALVIGLNYLRVRYHPPPRPLPGIQLVEAVGSPSPTTMPVEWRNSVVSKQLVGGRGTDSLGVVSTGRPVKVGRAISFPPAGDDHAAGWAKLDVVDMTGGALHWTAEVSTAPAQPGLWSSVKATVLETTPDPRAALMLMGAPGRYVAVVLSGRGEPMELEWGLGERRGAMLGPPSPPGGRAQLTLIIDHEGWLKARVGEHALGEPIQIGADWKKFFGEGPYPAVGCLEGACQMADLKMELLPQMTPSLSASAPPPEPIPREPSPKSAAGRPLAVKAASHHPSKPAPSHKPGGHAQGEKRRH